MLISASDFSGKEISSFKNELTKVIISIVEPIAIKTKDDLNQTPLVTSNDGDSSGLTITHTPFNDTLVSVEVNGLECNIGDGAKDEACYFSNDGGLTAKTMENIEANDRVRDRII